MKLTRFLTLTATLLGAAAAAHAQTVSPDPAPTIITTAPYTISTPGYYQLGANLTVADTTGAIITINSGNVILDFAGHYISGPSDQNGQDSFTLYGVYANEKGNITVRNGTIAYCQQGIYFLGNFGNNSLEVNESVQNMLVTYCSHIGINFTGCQYSSVSDCIVSKINGSSSDTFGNIGILANSIGTTLKNNKIVLVLGGTTSGTQASAGINSYHGNANNGTVCVGNEVFSCNYGLLLGNGTAADKYEDNITSACMTSFSGGTAVGSNN